MADFFAELKRRHIYRVGAAYVVVAWAVTQLIDVLSQIFELPGSIARPAVILLAIGFPVALIAAWMIESKPHEAVAAAVRSKPTIVDWTLCGALALVIVLIGYQQIARRPASVEAARAVSLAVLPFANVSGDASQEFFSDGMTDEIIAALAKIPSLQVVARTSAFQFKGERNDMRAIGQALNARYLIDGSVRRAGNRVRITAQLVQAENGIGVWTDSYDRELTDVFAIQEEIARAIAGALRVPLGLAQDERLVASRTDDLESYQNFLRARALFRARSRPEAIMLLESIVARDPNYAPAWALLSRAYRNTGNNQRTDTGSVEDVRRIIQSAYEKSEQAAKEAMRLDPKYPLAIAAQAGVEQRRTRAVAEDLYRQALAIDPGDPDILDLFSQLLFNNGGRLKEALQLREQLRGLEPSEPVYNLVTAAYLMGSGSNQAAIAMLERITPGSGDALDVSRGTILGRAYAQAGRYGEAADALLAIRSNLISRQSVVDAARLLREAPARANAASLPEFGDDLDFVYVHVGAPERVMDAYERGLEIRGNGIFNDWSPAFAPVRKTDRFKAYVRRAGLVDYWRAKGWPDLCRPVGADDFVCE